MYLTRLLYPSDRNILTGENCSNYDISNEMKSNGPRRRQGEINQKYIVFSANRELTRRALRLDAGKNTITGENCSTYDVNVENARKPGRARVRALSESRRVNPLSGENVSTFTISKEEKPRSAKPYGELMKI